jgi:hypothetical protein
MAGKPPKKTLGAASEVDVLSLLSGDPDLRARLEEGEPLRAVTPFRYPGRAGPVVVNLIPAEISPGSDSPVPVRISDNGDVLRSLEEQGMDLAVDMVLSKTVFHIVKEIGGAGIGGGHVFIDSDAAHVAADTWRFLQLVLEAAALRHSKYKDALIRLSRRQEGPDLINWRGR